LITFLLLREAILGQKGLRADQCNWVVLKAKKIALTWFFVGLRVSMSRTLMIIKKIE
jgi:hypothetical protein